MTKGALRWTEEQLADYQKRHRNMPDPLKQDGQFADLRKPPKPSKFNARICIEDGIKFRSEKERDRYRELKLLQAAGECWFLRQVPFYLPGNTRYVLDFLIFWKDGRQTFEDVKGFRTKAFVRSKKQVEALYPVRIEEL